MLASNSTLTLVSCPSATQAAAVATARVLTLVPANATRRFAICRTGGQYIVCTYVGGACIGRSYYESRESAWLRITELRGGVSL